MRLVRNIVQDTYIQISSMMSEGVVVSKYAMGSTLISTGVGVHKGEICHCPAEFFFLNCLPIYLMYTEGVHYSFEN